MGVLYFDLLLDISANNFVGKGLFTVVGGYNADPNDPNTPGQGVKWDDVGDVEQFRELYKVNGLLPSLEHFRLITSFLGLARIAGCQS